MSNPHIGSTFDSLLDEDGIRDEVQDLAQKRVLVWQLEHQNRIDLLKALRGVKTEAEAIAAAEDVGTDRGKDLDIEHGTQQSRSHRAPSRRLTHAVDTRKRLRKINPPE